MRKLIFFIVTLGLLVYFLPNILSSNWGKAKLQHHLESYLGGEVTINAMKLSWKENQVLTGIYWKQPESENTFYADQITCDASLWDCLTYFHHSLDLFLYGGRITTSAKFKALRMENGLTFHLTPVKARVANKVITFEHTEIYASEKLKFNMEGSLDIVTNHLDAKLGIPTSTLKKMFKIKEIPAGYVLEIPLSCQLNAHELETKLVWIFLKNYATVTSLQR